MLPPCSQRRKRELEVSISWDPVPPIPGHTWALKRRLWINPTVRLEAPVKLPWKSLG